MFGLLRVTVLAAALVGFSGALSGCANSLDPNYKVYVEAQTAIAAAKQAQPLVQIVAMPGQAITGLQSVTVYAPQQGATAPALAAPLPNPSPWAAVAQAGLGVLGQGLGYRYGAQAALGIAGAIKDAGIAGYSYVQAPGLPQSNVSISTVDSHNVSNSTSNSADSHNVSSVANTNTTTSTVETANSYNPATTTTNPTVTK